MLKDHRMALRSALVAGAVVSLALVPLPAQATHNCKTEEPRCVDTATLVQKPERQEVTSRLLGHHCYSDVDAADPNRDERVLQSRIGVVFSNVTRQSGFLETVTIYFEGHERQIMGSVIGFGRAHRDFSYYDAREFDPGYKITLEVGKKVDFNDYEGRKDIGLYNIRHDSAAKRPGGSGPGGNPRGPARPQLGVNCYGIHYFVLEVTPPSARPCSNKPPNPCPPG
ncbi:MAG: hypothetical protein LC792_23690 [Actinobacteria bacterium]|nr:hypothetical protein [Actinomycetota bacterium]